MRWQEQILLAALVVAALALAGAETLAADKPDTPAVRHLPRDAEMAGTLKRPDGPAEPERVAVIRDLLNQPFEQVAEATDRLFLEAAREIRFGRDIALVAARIRAEERLLHDLALFHVNCTGAIETRKVSLRNTVAGLARIFKPGTAAYRQAVARHLVEAKPKLDALLAQREEGLAEAAAARARLDRLRARLRYLELQQRTYLPDEDGLDLVPRAAAEGEALEAADLLPETDVPQRTTPLPHEDQQRLIEWFHTVVAEPSPAAPGDDEEDEEEDERGEP